MPAPKRKTAADAIRLEFDTIELQQASQATDAIRLEFDVIELQTE